MDIENKNLFDHALKTGVNLFLGSGFSVLSKDREGRNLPIGSDLARDLSDAFGKPRNFSLPQISSILEATRKVDFYKYLKERFVVGTFDPLYTNLFKIKVKSIYTTNIDDLILKIYFSNNLYFINDRSTHGPSTAINGIDYLALHGCVAGENDKFVFDVASLANIHHDAERIWNCLAGELESRPTIFIGYSFGDNSVLQTLTSRQTFNNAKKEIWTVLRPEEKEYKEYYDALGIKTIIGDTKSFLEYLSHFENGTHENLIEDDRISLLRPNIVPKGINELKFQRPIRDFYQGTMPDWCDILGNQIYKTHYFSEILDSIYQENKNTIIIGAPISGKSTLLRQVAYEAHDVGIKLFFDSISRERAEFIAKISCDLKPTVFIDNLYDSIDALEVFENRNIKVVAAERSHNYGIFSHLIDSTKYNIINVTALSDYDMQGIYNILPESIRGDYLKKERALDKYGTDSIFEFVLRNVSLPNIKERYVRALQKIEREDPDLAEFIVLCAYVHMCHIPLSAEMAHDYFDGFDFNDIFSLKEDSADIIKEFIPQGKVDYCDMDYYYPRSIFVAETIIEAASQKLLKVVLETIITNVHPIRICDYHVFRKFAFDKCFALRAFPEHEDGLRYYKNAYLYDKCNPYVLQQGALYLAQKKQYQIAFNMIDKAISMTDDRYFSIRNSHAFILFDANIEKHSDESRLELDKSMKILEKCMVSDSRKKFHACTYGSQAIKYYARYHDERAIGYLKQAELWLKSELKQAHWDIELKTILSQIQQISNL